MVPGPVRSYLRLDQGRIAIIGEIFDLGGLREKGMDYINVVDLKKGTTVEQFEVIKPFDIFDAVTLGPELLVVSVRYSGLVRWDTREMYGFDWRVKGEPVEFLLEGGNGKILAVYFQRDRIALIEPADGSILIEAKLKAPAAGKPVWDGKRYYVPTEGGLIVMDANLSTISQQPIEGLGGEARVHLTGEGLYLVDSDSVHYLQR